MFRTTTRAGRPHPIVSVWRRAVSALWPVMLIAPIVLYYSQQLTRWLAYDDEGGYLYAAWRISLGEMPYRDFLTPQMPVFLYPGALLLSVSDLSVYAARFASVALIAATGLICFAAVRRAWGAPAAVVTLMLLAVHRDIFWVARHFRPEASMLVLGMLGLYLFVPAYSRRHRGRLALVGVLLALSTFAKLFGALTMLGLGLFVLAEGVRGRDWRRMWFSGLWLSIPYALTLAMATALFTVLAPDFLGAVVGHHLQQGAGMPMHEVIGKTLDFYLGVLRGQPVYSALVLGGLWVAMRRGDLYARMCVWQLSTAACFLVMTRGLHERHLVYLMPGVAALATLPLIEFGRWVSARGAARLYRIGGGLALVIVTTLALLPHFLSNAEVVWREEDTTPSWVALIREQTDPGDYVLSDYPGLNFFAQRPTTPLGAGLSEGATESGQISADALIAEIEDCDVQMVLMNVAHGAHHLVSLREYETFRHYLQTHFALLERRLYDFRPMEVYHRQDIWEGERRNDDFGHMLALTGLDWEARRAEPGESLSLMLRWRNIAQAPIPEDYVATLRLVDRAGHVRGLGSQSLRAVDRYTYFDEEGVEQTQYIGTTQWPEAETTIDRFELPVDPATPPGEYRVLLRLHPEDAWDGALTRIDPSGAFTGYDLDLGMVEVLPAAQFPDAADLPMQTPVGVEVAPGLRLEGHTLPSGPVRPGDKMTASIFWSAESSSGDYMLRLVLRDQDRVWSETLAWPAGEAHPTSLWRAGEVILGMYDLLIDPETPSGHYSLMAEFLGGGRTHDAYSLGTVEVAGVPRMFEAPEVEHSLDVGLGVGIRLLGYDLPDRVVTADQIVGITLHWYAQSSPVRSYTVFVHLLDKEGQIVAQIDTLPLGGAHPTTAWLEDEFVRDDYRLSLPDDIAPGAYRIAVGLYDVGTGRRLPVYDGRRHRLADDRLLLNLPVVVQP